MMTTLQSQTHNDHEDCGSYNEIILTKQRDRLVGCVNNNNPIHQRRHRARLSNRHLSNNSMKIEQEGCICMYCKYSTGLHCINCTCEKCEAVHNIDDDVNHKTDEGGRLSVDSTTSSDYDDPRGIIIGRFGETSSSLSSMSPLLSAENYGMFTLSSDDLSEELAVDAESPQSSHGDGLSNGVDTVGRVSEEVSSGNDCYSTTMSAAVANAMMYRPGAPSPSSYASSSYASSTVYSSSSDSLAQQLNLGRKSKSTPSDYSQRVPVVHNHLRQQQQQQQLVSPIPQDNTYEMSPLMLPPPHPHQTQRSTSQDQYSLSNNSPLYTLSIADYEFYQLLQNEISSLQSQHAALQQSLVQLDTNTHEARTELLRTLAISGGDSKDESFVRTVEILEHLRVEQQAIKKSMEEVERVFRMRKHKLEELCWGHSLLPPNVSLPSLIKSNDDNQNVPYTRANENMEGQWFTLTKPSYIDCLGYNEDGNPMYRLGRMTFEMFKPGDLVCAIQAVFNPIKIVDHVTAGGNGCDVNDEDDEYHRGKTSHHFSVPSALNEEVQKALEKDGNGGDASVLRTYQ